MNKQKISTLFIIFTVVLIATIQNYDLETTQAVTTPVKTGDSPSINNIAINVTKKISDIDRPTPVEFFETNINNSFSVTIVITNNAAFTIYNIGLMSNESDVSEMNPSYRDEWFTFSRSPNQNWSSIDPDNSESITYTLTPHHEERYLFVGSYVYFDWGNSTDDYSQSNNIEFYVYKDLDTVRVEKSFFVNETNGGLGIETTNARVKVDGNFTIIIKITNFYLSWINITTTDALPGSSEDFFVYNTTYMSSEAGHMKINDTHTFSYQVQALRNETFVIPSCTVNFIGINETLSDNTEISNASKILVYYPIYEGDDWNFKIPKISISKYFLYPSENGTLIKRTELNILNNTVDPITIEINITNHGLVAAFNLTLEEQVYSDWTFDTKGVEIWRINNLTEGESMIFNYTILPLINGDFFIEPTLVTYDYFDQKFLIPVQENILHSNLLEITIEPFILEEPKATQWWITIGVSIGIVLLAVIPTIITFVTYRKRRKTQKGM